MDTFSRENEALRAMLKKLEDDGKADGLSPIGPWLKEIDVVLNNRRTVSDEERLAIWGAAHKRSWEAARNRVACDRRQVDDFIRQELAPFVGAPNTDVVRKQVVDVLTSGGVDVVACDELLAALVDCLSFDGPVTRDKMVNEARDLMLVYGHPVGNDLRNTRLVIDRTDAISPSQKQKLLNP